MVIKALQGTSHMLWKIQTLVRDISNYFKLMEHVTILHIFHEANMAADYIAKIGHATLDLTTWDRPPTTGCKDIMVADLMGRALMRRDT